MKVVIRVPDRDTAMFPGWGPRARWAWTVIVAGCAIAAVATAFLRNPAPPGLPPVERLLENAIEASPAGGDRFVYASAEGNTNGQFSLWQNANGTARRLTQQGAGDRAPDVSPDGKRVAFGGPSGIAALAVDGGGVTIISPTGRDPRFSPDGKRLAWTASGGVSIDGAILAPGLARPVWIDNRTLLAEGAGSWWIAGNAPPRRIGTRRGEAQFVRGGEIHYVHDGELWRIPVKGGAPMPAASAPHPIVWARAARDGALWLSTEQCRQDAWSLPIDGDRIAVRGRPARLTEDGNVLLPSMSGDGRRLVYTARRGGALSVWVRALDRDAEDRITTLDMPSRRPVLSYDGSQIALPVRDARGCRVSISSTVVFAQTASVTECVTVWDWAADGRRLLVAGGEPGRRTLELAVQGSRTTIIDEPELDVGYAHFAPSGRFIAFTAAESGGPRRTYVAPLPAMETVETLIWTEIEGSDGGYPAWSPNGRVLYFSVGDEIRAQRFDAAKRPEGAPVRVLRFGSPEFSIRRVDPAAFHLAVSRERLVFNAVELRGDIWKTNLP